MNQWTVIPFDPPAATAAQWAAFHAFRRQRLHEFDPEEPVDPDDVARKNALHVDPRWYNRRFAVEEHGQIVGMINAHGPTTESPEYDSWKHLVYCSGGVLAEYRRRGIGAALLAKAHDHLIDVGANVLTLYSEEPDGNAFLSAIGAEPKQTERRSRLELEDVDWSQVDRWIGGLSTRAQGTGLELYADKLPDELLEEYCPARTEMMNLMPWDDLDHGEIHITPEDFHNMYEELANGKVEHHTYISREPDGRISGITDMSWKPSAPYVAQQWFTGVHPDYRGRGLGKALKAAMLRYVAGRYDGLKYVMTENSATNESMLAINVRLGFREHRVGQSYQIGRDALTTALSELRRTR